MKTFLTILWLAAAAFVAAAQAPDLVLFNGKVFTGAGPVAEAVAIRGERIVAVGSDEEIRKMAGERTRSIDLGGRTVVPGFNDAHAHFGPMPKGVRLKLTELEPSFAEVAEKLKAAVGSAPKGEWIFGEIGGVVINDAAANRTALDAIAPDHPVVLETYFGHGLLINSAAMERLGVRDGQKDPFGGRMERDPASKKLNGKLFEYAHWRTTAKLAAMVPEADLLSEIKRRAVVAASYGVTTLQIMSLLPTRRFVELLEKADLPVRVRVINFGLTGAGSRDLTGIAEMARMRPKNSRVTVSGIKWILDGTPIERGAALRREYFDRQGWTGAMNFPQSDIEAMVRESLRYNQPLLLHCIGDRACSAAMDAMESVGEKMINWRAKRVRLEHGENVTGELIERAKRLGVIIVQNPTHFTDGEMGRARWGGGKSPIRSYVDAGIPFALGSDGPVNPFLNIMFATIHPDNPGQAISREQAVRAYTSGSAYAEFAETSKGTIEPGKLADIAVLSHDIFSVPTDSMPGTKSVMTIVGGKIVHDGLNSK